MFILEVDTTAVLWPIQVNRNYPYLQLKFGLTLGNY